MVKRLDGSCDYLHWKRSEFFLLSRGLPSHDPKNFSLCHPSVTFFLNNNSMYLSGKLIGSTQRSKIFRNGLLLLQNQAKRTIFQCYYINFILGQKSRRVSSPLLKEGLFQFQGVADFRIERNVWHHNPCPNLLSKCHFTGIQMFNLVIRKIFCYIERTRHPWRLPFESP